MDSFDKDQIDTVVYHGNCSDGFGGAFAAWYYYKQKFGLDRANAIFYKPGYFIAADEAVTDNFLDKFVGKNILMVDFTYKYPHLKRILAVAKSLLILDHHKSAEEDLVNIPPHNKVFDMNRSGCVIAWNYFFGSDEADVPVPRFLSYIQDRDLWRNSLPKLNEFVAFFYEIPFKFDVWETYMSEETVDKAIEIGTHWLSYKDVIVTKSAKKSDLVCQQINGRLAFVAYFNSPEFRSDIGNVIFQHNPLADFSVVWSYDLSKDHTSFSLRSTDDRFDVKEIAVANKGGGHRNASGVGMKGLCAILPYEVSTRPYMNMITEAVVSSIEANWVSDDSSVKPEPYSICDYVLFDCEILGKSFWRKPDPMFLELVHRKIPTANLVIFQVVRKISGKFPTPYYHIFHNGQSEPLMHRFPSTQSTKLPIKLDALVHLEPDQLPTNKMFADAYAKLFSSK